MNVSDFAFDLPSELIAQEPAARGASRLLVLHGKSGDIEHTDVSHLPECFRAGDLLVVNDTKVFPARLLGTRVPSGGAVECLLLSKLDAERWDALVHPGQKLQPGARMQFGREQHLLHAEVLERHYHGRRTIRLWTDGPMSTEEVVDIIGHIPLPPYIKRQDAPADRDRYQTVYARERGSVAAPTAGLHFTPEILKQLEERGVERASITLHVGYGTFQPVRTTRVEEHRVEPERFSIDESAARAIQRAKQDGRRVVAVGTTTTRALESAAKASGNEGAGDGAGTGPGLGPGAGPGVIGPMSGWADLFIYPGFTFQVVDALITNFHLPESSLLMLVSAFAGREVVLAAYREAVARGYRFYSYGDAMMVE